LRFLEVASQDADRLVESIELSGAAAECKSRRAARSLTEHKKEPQGQRSKMFTETP